MIKRISLLIVLLALFVFIYGLAKDHQKPSPKLPPGSTPVGATSDIEGKVWIWTETIENNDKSVVPKKPGVFSIVLKDGQLEGKTDCNSFGTDYTIGSDGVITFDSMTMTTMFCEGSQESVFMDHISKSSRYTLDPSGNLVLFMNDNSGSVYFRQVLSEQVFIKVGETKTVGDLSITFNKFLQDSRCPINSEIRCVHAGLVVINVTFSMGSTTITKNMPSDEVPQVFEGYAISIVDVAPARESKKEIKPEDYKITFHVERI